MSNATTPISGTERHDRFSAFIRRLAETQARALAGDPKAQLIMNEYGLAKWCGHRPEDAFAIAERDVEDASR